MPKRDFTINERIIARRKELGLNQTMLAESLGIKVSSYSQMERKGHITCETLRVLCEVLRVSTEFLLYVIKTEKDIGVTLPNTKRYEFLEDISDAELKILRQTVFCLRRDKRNCVYRFALDIIEKKIDVKNL